MLKINDTVVYLCWWICFQWARWLTTVTKMSLNKKVKKIGDRALLDTKTKKKQQTENKVRYRLSDG